MVKPYNQIAFLDQVSQALKIGGLDNPDLLTFWRGLPRDTEGRWEKYHKLAPHYYIGHKPQPTNSLSDKRFLKANIEGAKFLLKSLLKINRGMNDDEFFLWLIDLHKKQTYTPGMGGKILTKQITNQGRHTPMVIGDVVQLALKYDDSYRPEGIQILTLLGIDRGGLPKDIWSNNLVTHIYPHPQYYPDYLHMINRTLTQATQNLDKRIPLERKLESFAQFYQYGVNARMFKKTNHSLTLNICNTLLREVRLRGIESGILDFVAMRLVPKNFVQYFFEEIQRVNPGQKIK